MIELALPPKLWLPPEKPAIVRNVDAAFSLMPMFSPRKTIGIPVSLGANVGAALSSSITMTTSAAIPGGSLAVVAVIIEKNTSISVTSVSDGTNSYSLGKSALYDASSFACVEFWYCANANAVAAGATITANFSAAMGPGSGNVPVICAAYSTGVATVSPLDKTASAQFVATTAPSSGSSGTLTQAYEIVFGILGLYSSGGAVTLTESAGFTQVVDQQQGATGNWRIHLAYQIVNATTALNYQPTLSANSSGAQSIVATFKGA